MIPILTYLVVLPLFCFSWLWLGDWAWLILAVSVYALYRYDKATTKTNTALRM